MKTSTRRVARMVGGSAGALALLGVGYLAKTTPVEMTRHRVVARCSRGRMRLAGACSRRRRGEKSLWVQ